MKQISKEQLEKLYRNNPNKKCCKILGVAETTLLTLLAEAGIEKKGKGNCKRKKIKIIC
jgi:hypothetical protein